MKVRLLPLLPKEKKSEEMNAGIIIASIMAMIDEETETDFVYYYNNDDGSISETDEMDAEIKEIEDRLKFYGLVV